MPHTSRHAVNEDLDKRRQRQRHERSCQPRQLKRKAAQCRTDEDHRELEDALVSSAHQTLEFPPYDVARIRAGELRLFLGGLLIVGALISLYLMGGAQVGLFSTLIQVLHLVVLLVGVFLLWTGHDLRNGEHLPRLLTTASVQDAHTLLSRTQELARLAGSSIALHASRLLLLADSALLLFLLTPLLLPTSTPVVHLIATAAGAVLVAKIASDAVGATARAIRRGQVMTAHDALEESERPEAKASAAAIRAEYDPVMGNRWPRSPGFWTKYARVIPPVIILLTVMSVLLVARLWMSDTDTDLLTMGIVALVVFLSLAGAIALQVDSECLTPGIAMAKRIVGRFPTPEQFDRERAADQQHIRMGLIEARRILRGFGASRWHGVAARTRDLSALDLPSLVSAPTSALASTPAPASVHRIGSLGASPRPVAPAASAAVEHRAASGFRPNPDWSSR